METSKETDIPNNEKQSRLEEFIKNPTRSLWKLAVPMMFGMMVHTIYMLTDTAFIGNWVGPDALAALGYVFPFMFIIMGLTFGLGAGSTAVIARYIGKKSKESANIAASQTIIIGLIISLIILIFTFIFQENIFVMQGATGKSVEYAYDYFRILGSGSIFMILSMFIRAILSGEGDNKLPMIFLGIGTVLNIFLDPLFIYFYEIKGAAIATVISQMVSCLLFFYYILIKKGSYLEFSVKKIFEIDSKIIKEILKIGIPSSLSMIIMAIGALIFNLILDDPIAVAALQTCGRIEHLFFLPIFSIASSLVTLVGMYFGANRFDLIKKIVKYGITAGIIFSCISGLFFFFAAEYILPYFTDQTEDSKKIILVATGYFSVVCFSYPFVTIGMTSSRVMQGLGSANPVLIITLVRVVLINAPLGLFLTRYMGLGVEYVWYSILFSSFIASTIGLGWMRYIINLKMKV